MESGNISFFLFHMLWALFFCGPWACQAPQTKPGPPPNSNRSVFVHRFEPVGPDLQSRFGAAKALRSLYERLLLPFDRFLGFRCLHASAAEKGTPSNPNPLSLSSSTSPLRLISLLSSSNPINSPLFPLFSECSDSNLPL